MAIMTSTQAAEWVQHLKDEDDSPIRGLEEQFFQQFMNHEFTAVNERVRYMVHDMAQELYNTEGITYSADELDSYIQDQLFQQKTSATVVDIYQFAVDFVAGSTNISMQWSQMNGDQVSYVLKKVGKAAIRGVYKWFFDDNFK
jgi:hypothetical protein